MASLPTITINLDAKCAECCKIGAAENGICLGCTTKAIQGRPMKSQIGRAVQIRAREQLDAARRK